MSSAERPYGGAGSRAVIDIGSNTVRLVVYGGPTRAPTILHNEKVTARLGKGVAENGQLGKKAQASALAAIGRYHTLLQLMDVKQVQVAATAAVRDARNGPQFLDRVSAIGFAPRLLSGEEEALTSASGVAWAFPGAKGIVADLGGGSLELTDIDGTACSHGVSLPLGSLHLPNLRAGGERAFARRVAGQLRDADWTVEPGAALYLVGGSLRAFARHVLARRKWPVDDPHGFTMPADEALKLARSVVRKPPVSPEQLPGLSSGRIAALPHAAALLAVLITELKPAQLVFSAWGLREGLLFADAAPEVAGLDPLIAGVSEFVETQGVAPALAAMVAGWTLAANVRIADQSDSGSERLRLAATMLCLASSRMEPNLRASQAMEWALRKRWVSVSPQGRAMLAAAMLANAGRSEALPRLMPTLAQLASPAALREAQAWGLAVRLCRRFSGFSPMAVSSSHLALSDGELVLSVTTELAPLLNEGAQRDLKALADHLGVPFRLQPTLDTAAGG